MENVIKNRPEIGDIVILVNGKERFIRGAEATTAFLNTQQCIGVVYDVQGNYVRMVGGVNTTTKQWSCVADYEITAIPANSGDYEVVLNSASIGSFTYTKSSGSIEEFTDQLNSWLVTAAPKWEAYTNDGKSYLQMKTYDSYEGTVTVAGATLVKLIGSELAAYTSVYNRNQKKQQTTYNGMCRARLEEWATNNADANNNPSTEMNGTTQLFATFPCSKAYYDGALGSGLRTNFASYSLYLDACMVNGRELNHGIMQYRDGKLMTSLLGTKTILKAGMPTKAYSAAEWALLYDSNVAGYGPGAWWLPSMYEFAMLMRNIGATIDLVNIAISKKTGWTQIGKDSIRWSCCRSYSNLAWNYNGGGITSGSNFSVSFSCSAVSAFKIKY